MRNGRRIQINKKRDECDIPCNEAQFAVLDRGPVERLGNILFGGLIRAGVDAASGANYDLMPDSVYATLGRREQGLAGRR